MDTLNRRRFLAALAATGMTGLIGQPGSNAQDAPPETTTIRLPKWPSVCTAPQYAAEEFLRAEGFTEVRYLPFDSNINLTKAITRGEIDLALEYPLFELIHLDAGERMTFIAGVHAGCYELFAADRIRSVAALKGKRVGVDSLGSGRHAFLSTITAYVGLDPVKDIDWVASPAVAPKELFADGKIDAFLGFAQENQEVRARNIGHVLVNSSVDRPWSQYFCCMLAGNPDFIHKNPVATKRALRAVLKATDLCASQPEQVARQMLEGGFATQYDYALQTLRGISYNTWRTYDPEDAIRFYALRLRELGIIKSSPNRIIAESTDWRFLNELKRELKG
jgi:NitT/TauT family transport system substrate-binding protein